MPEKKGKTAISCNSKPLRESKPEINNQDDKGPHVCISAYLHQDGKEQAVLSHLAHTGMSWRMDNDWVGIGRHNIFEYMN